MWDPEEHSGMPTDPQALTTFSPTLVEKEDVGLVFLYFTIVGFGDSKLCIQ